MTYRIEDIDWKTIPEGATHFTLAGSDQNFKWYRHSRGLVYTDERVASEKNWKLHFGNFQDLPEHALLVRDHHPDRAAKSNDVIVDWDMMPEGATHFTLAERDKPFTWYRHDRGHVYIYDWVESAKWWRLRFGNWQRLPEDALIVRDHHPDWVAKRKEQQAREASCKAVQAFVEHILNKHKLMLSAHAGEARRAAEDYCRLITVGKA